MSHDPHILADVNAARKALGFPAYGEKRSYRKIDIFAKLSGGRHYYLASTTWARSCKEAREMYVAAQERSGYGASDLVAFYAAKGA